MTTELDLKDLVVSEWINEEFFAKVLSHHESANVEIIKFKVKPGAAKGENFASTVFRVTLEYSVNGGDVKNISLILKTNLDADFMNEIQEEFNIFDREKAVYKQILNGMNDLMNKFGDGTIFSPRLIYDDEKSLVLEDLSVKGYKLSDRKLRLDLNHSQVVIKKLAKFHAASAVLSKKNINAFQLNLEGLFGDASNPIQIFYQNSIEECVQLAKSHAELNGFVEFLTKFGEEIIEKEKNTFTRIDKEFNVLNHGDLWINNLLWKEDADGNIEDLLFIDHQEGYYGTPGIDLNHFLYTSCNSDVFINHMEQLVQLYFDELLSTLQQLKYDEQLPTLDDIKRGMLQKCNHAVVVATSIIPVMIIENAEHASAENFIFDSDEAKLIRKEVFSNPKYIEILKHLLPKLVSISQEL